MTIATSTRSRIVLLKETVFGTTPAVTPGDTSELPDVQWSVNTSRDYHLDNSIRSDSIYRYDVAGNKHVAGDFDVNFSTGNFDPLMEAVLFSAFSAGTLKAGTTPVSFTFEQGQEDISQYDQFTGVMVSKASLTIPVNGLMTGKFSLMGKTGSLSGTPLDSAPTAPIAVRPLEHNGGTFKEGGVTTGILSNITMDIDAKLTANFSLGSDYVRAFTRGFLDITGTAVVYYEDAAMINKHRNDTLSSLEFQLTDGVNTYDILLPAVKYETAAKQINGNNPVTVTLQYRALYDATAGSHIVITKA